MWYTTNIPQSEFTIFRAYPKKYPPTICEWKNKPHKEIEWETLLGESSSLKREKESTCCLCICFMCGDVFESCDCKEVIKHLKGEEHMNVLLEIVPKDNTTDKPVHFCQVCQYPGYNEINMNIHNASDEHKKNLAEKKSQEEDCKSRKRTPEEDLLNEANKKR